MERKKLPIREEFQGQFTCLGENTEKNKTFTVLIKKEVIRMGKKIKEISKSRRLNRIDRAIFMRNSLSNLFNNLHEAIHITKCKN